MRMTGCRDSRSRIGTCANTTINPRPGWGQILILACAQESRSDPIRREGSALCVAGSVRPYDRRNARAGEHADYTLKIAGISLASDLTRSGENRSRHASHAGQHRRSCVPRPGHGVLWRQRILDTHIALDALNAFEQL